MTEDPITGSLDSVLQGALAGAEALKARIEAGEDIPETELEAIAKLIANQMEQARAMLEAVVGQVDHEALKANLKAKLSPEEYANWLAAEEDRSEQKATFLAKESA